MIAIFAYVEHRGRRKFPLNWRVVFARHDETGKDAVPNSPSEGKLASSDTVSSEGASADLNARQTCYGTVQILNTS